MLLDQESLGAPTRVWVSLIHPLGTALPARQDAVRLGASRACRCEMLSDGSWESQGSDSL